VIRETEQDEEVEQELQTCFIYSFRHIKAYIISLFQSKICHVRKCFWFIIENAPSVLCKCPTVFLYI
jgi:hypothetical protein